MSGFDAEGLAPVLAAADFKTIEPLLVQIEKFLTLRTYLDGYDLSSADEKVWTSMRTNKVAAGIVRKATYPNVTRWFTYLENVYPEVKEAAAAGDKAKKGTETRGKANYNIGLKDTESGVVTRFPPEPS
jgi:glutamyl-tRNA synthetase